MQQFELLIFKQEILLVIKLGHKRQIPENLRNFYDNK